MVGFLVFDFDFFLELVVLFWVLDVYVFDVECVVV